MKFVFAFGMEESPRTHHYFDRPVNTETTFVSPRGFPATGIADIEERVSCGRKLVLKPRLTGLKAIM
jgi:hypothetical protein